MRAILAEAEAEVVGAAAVEAVEAGWPATQITTVTPWTMDPAHLRSALPGSWGRWMGRDWWIGFFRLPGVGCAELNKAGGDAVQRLHDAGRARPRRRSYLLCDVAGRQGQRSDDVEGARRHQRDRRGGVGEGCCGLLGDSPHPDLTILTEETR